MSREGTLAPAYILHARDYRDTSVILDLLTQHEGRFSMVARGARSARSRLRGRLQPFAPMLISAVGRGELKTAAAIDFSGPSHRLTGYNLLLGLYVNELLYRLLGRFDPVTDLYDYYETLLARLQQTGNGVNAVRDFEINLLQELGYGINFDNDAGSGGPIEKENSYRYVFQAGFHRTADVGDDVFPGDELMQIASGEYDGVNVRRLRNLIRRSLAELLGGKPLKSRTLFREVGG